MALERLTQITEVGIQSGITLRNVNVEGAFVSGVVTATSLNITSAGANFVGVVTATSFNGNVTGNITPSGLVVSGVSTFQASSFWGDGDVAYFGDGQDLLIFHNSTDSIIRDNGTGDLYIEGGNRIRLTNPTALETYAVFNQDGASELYYDNVKRLETSGIGVSITSALTVGTGASISSPATNVLTLGTNNSERVRVDSGGNLGIGTVPKTWTSGYNVLQVGSASLVGQSEQDGQTSNWSNNAYFDTNDNRWEYSFADQASQITQSDGLIIFKTASTGTANAALSWTESARFNTSGNLAFPSGQGIDFSATANSSGTMSSELLNDYETGTWTPAWTTSSGVYSGITYNTQAGNYTKIGNMVFYDFLIISTNWNGNTGAIWIAGLPYAASSTRYQQGGGSVFFIEGFNGSQDLLDTVTTQIQSGATRIELYGQLTSAGTNYADLNNNHINEGGTVNLRISGQYFV